MSTDDAEQVAHCWPLGHFYSPVPDTVRLASEPTRSRVWPPDPPELAGIDWRAEQQVAFVRDELARQPQIEIPSASTGDPTAYHTDNPFLRRCRTCGCCRRCCGTSARAGLIEIGGGWTSLMTARINREHLGGGLDFTSVEPYPADFLSDELPGLARLLVMPVEDVPLEHFLALESGDVLFIDSSHVIKTGNDVRFLYHEVLPRLAPGVVVHVHDVFLPWDYPEEWVMDGRGWNEQYLLQSFLQFNSAFEVLAANCWLARSHPDLLTASIPGYLGLAQGGGSFWMRRRPA